jgi:hypothetical protein
MPEVWSFLTVCFFYKFAVAMCGKWIIVFLTDWYRRLKLMSVRRLWMAFVRRAGHL